METICTGHRAKPFVDGKTYKAICHCCFEVPKCETFVVEKPGWVTMYSKLDPASLHTLEELMEFGFNKKEAINSIKCVQQSIKKNIKKNT